MHFTTIKYIASKEFDIKLGEEVIPYGSGRKTKNWFEISEDYRW